MTDINISYEEARAIKRGHTIDDVIVLYKVEAPGKSFGGMGEIGASVTLIMQDGTVYYFDELVSHGRIIEKKLAALA